MFKRIDEWIFSRLLPSLHARLVLSHLLVSLVSIVLISVFAGRYIFQAALAELEHNLQTLAFASGNALEPLLNQYRDGKIDSSVLGSTLDQMFQDYPEIQYTLYLPDGSPLIDDSGTLPPAANRKTAPEVMGAFENDAGRGTATRSGANGKQYFYLAALIQTNVENLGIIRLGVPMEPAMQSARQSLGVLILVAILVASGISLFGWLLANNLARPIVSLTRTAEQFSRGDLTVRVEPKGTQEMRHLADAFNTMAGKLQENVRQMRDFVANASHELRTPLTVVKLRVEALRAGALEEPEIAGRFLGEIENEVNRLVRMVNDLLDLSRMEAGLDGGTQDLIDLGLIANDVYSIFNMRAGQVGVNLELDVESGLPLLEGNEDQIRRVFYNLVENAIKFTPTGGKVQILLRGGLDQKNVRLLVKDNGPGIPPEVLPHVFERFYRAETGTARTGMPKGSGLGLAIAKSIVENHGGQIGVSSQVGEGTTLWAELPAVS